MKLFGRPRSESATKPFWEKRPLGTDDPQLLYRHGVACVGRSDGAAMISVGWALWGLVGLDQLQAYDFLRDGYQAWARSGALDGDRMALLQAMLRRLRTIQPEVPPAANLFALPPGVADRASHYYGARCWAASELLEVAGKCGALSRELEDDVYRMLNSTHPDFMPPRSRLQLDALRRDRG